VGALPVSAIFVVKANAPAGEILTVKQD
jgi:hypothetical protein